MEKPGFPAIHLSTSKLIGMRFEHPSTSGLSGSGDSVSDQRDLVSDQQSGGGLATPVVRSAAALAGLMFAISLHPCAVHTVSAQDEPQQQITELPNNASPVRPRNLAKDRYVDRQRATLEMWRGRTQSRQAVQDATRNPDPEVAERAEWILRQWRNGVLPGVGQDQGELLPDHGSDSALESVLELGAFDAVLVAVEESAGTIEFDQIKKHVADLLIARYPFYSDRAFAEGTETELLKLLDAVAIDRNFATATRDLMKYSKIQIDDTNRMPSAAAVWDKSERQICLAQLAMLDGDRLRSVRFAEQAGDPVALRIARMLAGHWDEIGRDSLENAEQAATIEERIESAAWALAAGHRVNDQSLVEQMTKQLRDHQAGESEIVRNLRWRGLAIHGDIDGALEIMAGDVPAAAAKVACAASRFVRAEQLCGFDLDSIDSELNRWIKDAFAEQASLPAGEIAPAMERLYSLARLLVNTGDKENAWRIYRRLTPRQVIVSPYGTSLREQTLRELSMINRFDWLLDIAVAPGENAVTRRAEYIIASTLNTESESFSTVLDRLKVIQPRTPFRDRFQIAFQLFRGKTPDGFDPDQDFKALYEALVQHRQVQRTGIGRSSKAVEVVTLDLEMIDMLTRHGQVKLARDGLTLLARNGNLDAMISLAETEMELGDSQAAAELWKQVAATASQPETVTASGSTDRAVAYAKAVVGSWILAKRAGHQQLASELESRVRLMTTSPSLNFRKELADHLREVGQFELAIEVFRDLVVSAAFGGEESPDFFKTAVAYLGALEAFKSSDPDGFQSLGLAADEIVKWSDLAIFGILNTTMYYDTAFVSVPLSIRKAFLQHAIDSQDKVAAEDAITELESFDPLNIDFGERMLPELRKAGMTELADSAFDRLINRGHEHVRQFPGDATALNNLAWAAAMNQRRLDEALQLSEQAVLREPDSVVYRDTLAEVLHLLGRTEEGLAIESACLLDEPDEWHLHEQIKKYRALLAPQP